MNPAATLCAIAAAFASIALPQPAAGQAPAPDSISAADLRRRLEVLADDSMLGRGTGQLGGFRATRYIAAELARFGLRPAGASGTFFQEVPLRNRAPDSASALAAGGQPLRFGADLLPLRAIGGSPLGGTFDGRDVPVVFGGRIGEPTLIRPEEAAGKFVILLPRLAGQALTFGFAGAGGALAPYRDARALAIVALGQLPQGVRDYLEQPRVLFAAPPGAAPPIPSVVVTPRAAELLMGRPLGGLVAGAPGLAVSGTFGFQELALPIPPRNVAAVLPGSDPALRAQYVGLSAHSDHIGLTRRPLDHDSVRAFNASIRPLGANDPERTPTADEAARIRLVRDSLAALRPSKRDSISNGADDNASGVSVLLELAEHFSRHPPRRSLLFFFPTAEEVGLFGAEYFTDHPTLPLDSIVALINIDQVGRGWPGDMPGIVPGTLFALGTRRLSTELGDLVERVNRESRAGFTFDYSFDANGHPANGYCRSDHYMFARYGVPIAFFSAAWHRDYHMVTDEAAYINDRTMYRVAGFVGALASALGDLPRPPLVDKPKPDPKAACRQ